MFGRGGKKEACRNFIRGSCQYGDRCKFSHSSTNNQPQHHHQTTTRTPPPPTSTSPFGFRALDARPNSSTTKPFQNKWTRDTTAAPPPQNNKPNDPPQPDHACTSPDVCKRQMLQDFQNENPPWKLTCYGHFRHLPCDIIGDISSEELRAAAYDDANKGFALSTVIERERNMVNAKLIEFENLVNNPRVSQNAVIANISHFPSANMAQSPTAVQTNGPPQPVSSFSQLGVAANQEFKTSAVATSKTSFGENSLFPASCHTSEPFGAHNQDFGSRGLFGKQHIQSQGNSSTVNIPFGFGNNPTTASSNSMQPVKGNSFPSSNFSLERNAAAGSMGQQTYVENGQGVHGDMSIWLKSKWNPGEIPDEAPPSEACT